MGNRIIGWLETLFFSTRPVVVLLFIAVTAFMGFEAAHTQIKASYYKQLPRQHPYMATYFHYRENFGSANHILVALVQRNGQPIFNKQFMQQLEDVTTAVFNITGIKRSSVKSLFTPNVNYFEVTRQGFKGGPVVPARYKPSPQIFRTIRQNVLKANIVGRLVSNNLSGAMVSADLLEKNPVTGKKTDYQRVAADLEQIRHKYQTQNIRIEIIGFAKVIGDIAAATGQVVSFFGIVFVITALLLLVYLGSYKLAVVPLLSGLCAIIWELGMLNLLGYGLDPYAILVPFLIFSIAVSHATQKANNFADNLAAGDMDSLAAARHTFRYLVVPAAIAIVTGTVGFATMYLIPIQAIRELAITASIGVAVILLIDLILVPVLLSYLHIKKLEKFRDKMRRREALGDKLWRPLSRLAAGRSAIITLIVCVILVGLGYREQQNLTIGVSHPGVPALRPDSRYNQDARAIQKQFDISTNLLMVIAETQPSACIKYRNMEVINRFAHTMDNVPGVVSTTSLAGIAPGTYQGYHHGSLKWHVLPRNRYALAQAIHPVQPSSGLLNNDCSAMPILVFTTDHRASTLKTVTSAVKLFNVHNHLQPQATYSKPGKGIGLPPEQLEKRISFVSPHLRAIVTGDNGDKHPSGNPPPPVYFNLAAGPVGVMAATNEVIDAKEGPILLYVYLAVIILCLISFRSIGGALCVLLPLAGVSVLAYALMALLGIGLKTSTLPIAALGVGLGVDYGIYIFNTMFSYLHDGLPLQQAYYQALRRTGKVVLFIGIILAVGVSTWLFSGLQFQADMGLLLIFFFIVNMLGAIFVLPALARFLLPGKLRKGKTGQ